MWDLGRGGKKKALGHVFLWAHRFPPVSIIQPMLYTHLKNWPEGQAGKTCETSNKGWDGISERHLTENFLRVVFQHSHDSYSSRYVSSAGLIFNWLDRTGQISLWVLWLYRASIIPSTLRTHLALQSCSQQKVKRAKVGNLNNKSYDLSEIEGHHDRQVVLFLFRYFFFFSDFKMLEETISTSNKR